ncbi:hypothetical protein V8E36_008783 [Tilletia maclaganii]
MSANSSKTRSKDKGDGDEQKQRAELIPVTHDDLAALDSAHVHSDEQVRLMRTQMDAWFQEHSSAITDLLSSVDGISDYLKKLLALSSSSVSHSDNSPTTSQQHSSYPSTVTPSIYTASASAPATPTSTTSATGGNWDSAAAAAAGAGTGRDRSTRLAVVTPGEDERYFTVKQEELGRYDGTPEDAALFIANVMAIRGTPLDLWFASMPDEERHVALQSLDSLLNKLKRNFAPPQSVVRRQARDRRWDPETEDAVQYTFIKAALMKTGFPSMSEEDLVHEVVDGIDSSMAKLLQNRFRREPTLTAPRTELRIQETFWRTERVRPLLRSDTKAGAADVPRYATLTQPADAYNQTPDTRRGRPIREQFNPQHLAYRIHPTSKKVLMSYRIEGTNRIIWCNRPCKVCAKDHFDFAHDHCQKHRVPTLHAAVHAAEADEGYEETSDVDGIEQSGN